MHESASQIEVDVNRRRTVKMCKRSLYSDCESSDAVIYKLHVHLLFSAHCYFSIETTE